MQKIGKEVKIGLAVIGVLLVAFGYVLVHRLTQPSDPAALAAATDGGDPTKSAADGAAHSDKPTIVAASSSSADANPDEPKRGLWAMGASRRANDPKSADASDEPKDAASDGHDPAAPKSARRNTLQSFAAAHAGGDGAGHEPAVRDAAAEADRRAGGFFAHDDHGASDAGANGVVQVGDTAPAAGKQGDADAAVTDNGANQPAPRHNHPPADGGKFAAAGDGAAPADPFAKRASGDAAPAAAASADPFQHRDAFQQKGELKAQAGLQNTAPPADAAQPDPAAGDRSLVPPDGLGFRPAGAAPSQGDGNPLRRVQGQATQTSGDGFTAGSQNPPSNSAPLNNGAGGDASGRFGVTNRPAPPASLDPVTTTAPLKSFGPTAGDQTPVNSSTPAGLAGVGLNDGAKQLIPVTPQIGSTDKPGQYTVQPNDNYWTISEKVYGTGGYFKAIFEQNRRQHPQAQRLQVGEVLSVPDVDTLQKNYPDLCPKPGHAAAPQRTMPASARVRPGTKVYVVEEGDTLFEIARRQLGKPSRWGEIYQLNREALGNDFDYLKPGTEILIPSDGAPATAPR